MFVFFAMGKQGAVGAAPAQSVLKRPAALGLAGGNPTLADSMAQLESIGDINQFRDRARDLGVTIKYRNASGQWVNRRKADMLVDCRQVLMDSFHAADAEAVQGRDEIRSRAAELGVKRYKACSSSGQTTWRTVGELVADCDKAMLLAEKNSLPSLFDRQLKSRQGLDSES